MTWLHEAAIRAGALPAPASTDDSDATEGTAPAHQSTPADPEPGAASRPVDTVEVASDGDSALVTADKGPKTTQRSTAGGATATERLHRVAVAPSDSPNQLAPISKEESARIARGAKLVEVGAKASKQVNGDDPYAVGTNYSRQRVPADPRVRYPYGSDYACNVFAGDAGTVGGLRMPTRPTGGGDRGTYMNAGNLPSYDGFVRVEDRNDVREGDFLSRYGGRGAMESHIEVVTRVERDAAGAVTRVYSTGARRNGVQTSPDHGNSMRAGTADGDGGFSNGVDTYYILRPRRSMLR